MSANHTAHPARPAAPRRIALAIARAAAAPVIARRTATLSARLFTPRFATLAGLLFAAVATPPTALAEAPLDSLNGFEGRWLRNGRAEVFVAVRPRVRVLAYRPIGEASLMADDSAIGEVGVRLAFMEPKQIRQSFGPGNQPGRFTAVDGLCATVLAKVDAASGLQLEFSARLDPVADAARANRPAEAPTLHLEYALHNRSGRQRRIALWSVTALPREGALIVPFGDQPRALRRLVYSWWTRLPQQGLRFGRDALLVNLGEPLAGNAFKVGVITEAGWVAAFRPASGQALLSRVAYQRGKAYPEGGANITLFQADGDRRWAEFERVGPLTDVDAGEAVAMSETLTLLELTPPAEPNADPDAWRGAIEAAMHAGE